MIYALFEFVNEKSCEIGETRWIMQEDVAKFDNENWNFEHQVLVKWPKDITGLSKKIMRTTIDPDTTETITCVAKVLKFSDHYNAIHKYRKNYIDTGTTLTPSHGRGQRVSKKNSRYESNGDGDDSDGSVNAKQPSKRPKTKKKSPTNVTPRSDFELIARKYKLNANQTINDDHETNELCLSADEYEQSQDIGSLQSENAELKNAIKQKDVEIERLQNALQTFKAIPMLQEVVTDLKNHVACLKMATPISKMEKHVKQSPLSCLYPRTPTHNPPKTPTSSGRTSNEHSPIIDLENEPDLVILCPNVTISKGQCNILRSKQTAKEFIFTLMGMLWTRKVLGTHSVTGRTSNAFQAKDAKPALDQTKVQSICEYASKKFGCTESEAKQMMSTKVQNVTKVYKAQQKIKAEPL